MEWKNSWISYEYDDPNDRSEVFDSYAELNANNEEQEENNLVSINSVLPDDLLEQILAFLPMVTVTCSFTDEQPTGYVHDPMIPKWYSFDIPDIRTRSCLVSSSCGPVCFMDNNNGGELYVCNPMTKDGKKIGKPPGFEVYDSQSSTWLSLLIQHMDGWRGGAESVICDGVLWLLVCKATGNAPPGTQHGLVTYDLSNDLSKGSSSGMDFFIHAPCWLTCGRLMNQNSKLVLVGGIGRQDRMDVIKGIGIWTLNGKKWEEITRMPRVFPGLW
ncbi:hypothetical protein RJ641_035626 [Dillenia turbinata]|uniref:F-box domain-containing protein n=1 Tax=Dillenia turbinata TaxID=194707 RepID=A0AAN8VTD3_9MAGN